MISKEFASPYEIFRQTFIDSFNEQELRDICLDLNIGLYDDLPGSGRKSKVRELIKLCQRQGRLAELIRYCRRHRPQIEWPDLEHFFATAGHGREAPPLLPYMVDRVEQEIQVEKAIHQLAQQPNAKPFVFIIYGERKQGHDSFVDRLKETLPEKLNVLANDTAVTEYPLRLPSPLDTLHNLHERMQERLSRTVLGTSTGSMKQISTKLIEHRTPIIIQSRISGEEWRQHGIDMVKNYTQFWQNWPTAVVKQTLFVVFIISYRPEIGKRWWRFGKPPIQEQIRQALEQYQAAEPHGIAVLPELSSIAERQAEEWVELKETQTFCKLVGLTDNFIRNQIHRFYEKWEQDFQSRHIPLDHLAEELTNILNSHLTQA